MTFRKRALKTHPDKGGDPVEFKKINDAYNRLMGHIIKVGDVKVVIAEHLYKGRLGHSSSLKFATVVV